MKSIERAFCKITITTWEEAILHLIGYNLSNATSQPRRFLSLFKRIVRVPFRANHLSKYRPALISTSMKAVVHTLRRETFWICVARIIFERCTSACLYKLYIIHNIMLVLKLLHSYTV